MQKGRKQLLLLKIAQFSNTRRYFVILCKFPKVIGQSVIALVNVIKIDREDASIVKDTIELLTEIMTPKVTHFPSKCNY